MSATLHVPPVRRHLRLVHERGATLTCDDMAAQSAIAASSRLVAVRHNASNDWRPSAFYALIWSLRAVLGSLTIRMTFEPSPSVEVEIRCHDVASFPKDRLTWALQASWPSLVFKTQATDSQEPQGQLVLPIQHCLGLAPLHLRRRHTGKQQTGANALEACIPHPGKWPGPWVGTAFHSPLHRERWQLELEFSPWSPDAPTQSQWQQLYQGQRRGQWDARGGGRNSSAVIDNSLEAAAQENLHAWLQQPELGCALRARLRASSPFDDWALRRILLDVFGQLPVDVTGPADSAAATDRWPGCFLPRQGEGGWMPLPSGLLEAGIAPAATEPSKLPDGPGVSLGHSEAGHSVVLPETVRSGHLLVVGSSGTGKSTTLCRIMLEDIEAGHGAMLLDPHGDLYERLRESIPARRRDDVVLFDAGDPDASVSLNPLEGTSTDRRQRSYMAGTIVDLVDHLFESEDSSGPVLRNHLRHALLLAMCHPSGGVLADTRRVFLDRDFREWLLTKADAQVKAYFDRFQSTHGEHGFANWMPYILARLDPFSSSRIMLAALSRPSTVDLSALMHERAIVLVRIPRARMTETECRIFGALVLLACFRSAMRLSSHQAPPPPFRLTVDEFHLFATPAIPPLFREARKFGLCLTVATQSFGSLRHPKAPNLVNDVLTNTAAKLMFRVSPSEANMLEEYTAPRFQARALSRMPNHKAVLALASLGLEPVGVQMARPSLPLECADPQALLEHSARRHATPMSEVMEYLASRHGIDPVELT